MAEDLGLARRTVGDSSSSSSGSDDSSSSDGSDDAPDRPSYVLQLSDDRGDKDMLALLEDSLGFSLGACTTGRMLVPPQDTLPPLANIGLLSFFRRVSITPESKELGPLLAGMFQEMLLTLSFRLRAHATAGSLLCGVRTHLSHPEENMLQLGIVAMALTPQVDTPLVTAANGQGNGLSPVPRPPRSSSLSVEGAVEDKTPRVSEEGIAGSLLEVMTPTNEKDHPEAEIVCSG